MWSWPGGTWTVTANTQQDSRVFHVTFSEPCHSTSTRYSVLRHQPVAPPPVFQGSCTDSPRGGQAPGGLQRAVGQPCVLTALWGRLCSQHPAVLTQPPLLPGQGQGAAPAEPGGLQTSGWSFISHSALWVQPVLCCSPPGCILGPSLVILSLKQQDPEDHQDQGSHGHPDEVPHCVILGRGAWECGHRGQRSGQTQITPGSPMSTQESRPPSQH